MTGVTPTLDRAEWKRFADKGGRCLVCGHTAVVSVSITSTELTGDKGGSQLAREVIHFCHDHGIMRYADALNKLRGTVQR